MKIKYNLKYWKSFHCNTFICQMKVMIVMSDSTVINSMQAPKTAMETADTLVSLAPNG